LAKLIREKKAESGVPRAFYISERTILSRIKQNQIDPPHPGVSSPIKEAEEALVELCIAMGNIPQPLTATEGLQLMNSLIKDQPVQEKLKEFKWRQQPRRQPGAWKNKKSVLEGVHEVK
jgi:hypothetical protein